MMRVMLRCAVAVGAAFALGCEERTTMLGAFLPGPNTDAAGTDMQTCVFIARTATLEDRLPISDTTALGDLPSTLPLGPVVARKQFTDPLNTLPEQWTRGTGAYDSSLSEFGEAGVAFGTTGARLSVAPKSDPVVGDLSRPFWGGELNSPAVFGHGLFLARVRSDGWQYVQSSFFFANDKISTAGKSLGWTGAIAEFTHDGEQLRLAALFHDSSAGRHDSRLLVPNVQSGREMLVGLLSLPGRVAFYVDGQKVHEWQDADTLALWSFQFTHWINNPAPRPFRSSPTPVLFEIDFVAHYAVDVCP